MIVPQDILDRIKAREGFATKVYKDTRGFPTAGTGHKLVTSERIRYPVGSIVPDDVLQSWEAADTLHAYQDGVTMAARIGVDDPRLIEALTCAAFQLGDHIPTEFPTLWGLLMQHRWEDAAEDAGTTLWDRQTPVRVQDFQGFLRSLIAPATPAEAIT